MNRCEKELFVESYFGLTGDINERMAINTDYGQLVNLLAMYHDSLSIDVVKDQKVKTLILTEVSNAILETKGYYTDAEYVPGTEKQDYIAKLESRLNTIFGEDQIN